MRLRTFTGTTAVLSVLCASIAVWLTVAAPEAQALTQDRITIGKDEVIEIEFDPIIANNPLNEAQDPATCATSAYCDLIPLTVDVPDDIGPDDEYFLQYLLTWDSPKLPPDPVLEPEGRAVNDLDTYVYTDPPTFEEAETRGAQPDSEGDPHIASGASGGEPEQAFLFKPDGDYLLTVINFLGSNTGYTVKLTWVSESFPEPFESLAPTFSPSAPVVTTTTRPATTTPTTRPPVTAPSPSEATDVTLPALDVTTDADFAGDEFAAGSFEDRLTAPSTIPLAVASAASATPPSALALVFWLLAVPLACCAVGGALVMRRSSRMISI